MCINSLCFLQKPLVVPTIYVTCLAHHTIVKLRIKSQFDFELVLRHKNNIYVEENTNCVFLLELLVSQIRLVATQSDPNCLIKTCVQQQLNKNNFGLQTNKL